MTLIWGVGAGKSNNYSKEPIKASESFIVTLTPFIVAPNPSWVLLTHESTDSTHNSLISALKWSFGDALEGLEQLREVKMGEVTSTIPAVWQGFWALTSTTKQHTGEAPLDLGCCSKWPFKIRGVSDRGVAPAFYEIFWITMILDTHYQEDKHYNIWYIYYIIMYQAVTSAL